MRVGLVCVGIAIGLMACGGEKKSDPPPATPPQPSASAAPVASAPPAPAETGPTAAQRKPLEIYNGCKDVKTVVFADDPAEPGAQKRTIAGFGTSDGPRRPDGTNTVWLVDDQGRGLIHVRVSKQMKRVEIGASCLTLDSH